MQSLDNNTKAFMALMRAGLWETDVQLSTLGDIDFAAVYRIAQEQAVVGVVAAALDHLKDKKVPFDDALPFMKGAMKSERKNQSMNTFLADIYGRMREEGINPILVKGQGIAQCYERPLWRAPGDIDLMLNEADYEKSKAFVGAIGKVVEDEHEYRKRIEYKVDPWLIELHGTMRGQLGRRIDRAIDQIQREVCEGGRVRSWINAGTEVLLPAPDEDVILVFAHILQHFFRGGIGLRQVCDWCRLLWRYRSELDPQLLESRIRAMGIMTEWQAFAALAVHELGMPVVAMPFYSDAHRCKKKSLLILRYILAMGNFGFNRDLSYKKKYPFFKRMLISLKLRTADFLTQFRVFPVDAVRAYYHLWLNGLEVVLKKTV